MSQAWITNPILPGFNPDPSILRVGEDFYIATSTFQWFPGVQIHHSRDLVHWRLLCHPLTRVSQLDMAGNHDGGGIWAPCLSYADGRYWLIYTNTRSRPGAFLDTPNYLVTAESITGPWSEPVYLNASGFDPSLFHDDDGRKWLVNMVWDHRPGRGNFAGIVLQEYSAAEEKLIGPAVNIYRGSDLGATEGPHLYKRGGWYYLVVAEGGTGYGHAVTVARSRKIEGPYETDPDNPMLTSRDRRWDPAQTLQKAGHASLVDTPDGRWYLAHLTGRPVQPSGRCPLGRETAIQQVCWSEDGWLRLVDGGHAPAMRVAAPELAPHPFPAAPVRDDFDVPTLSEHYSTLRRPAEPSWLSLTDRPGWLRLRGRMSLNSCFDQSLLARRVQAHRFRAATKMRFRPEHFQQMAGLVLMYNSTNWRYLFVSADDAGRAQLNIYSCHMEKVAQLVDEPVDLGDFEEIHLALEVDGCAGRFSYSLDGLGWTDLGVPFDFTLLSDESSGPCAFTGCMVGLCCQDLSGQGRDAFFDWFEYEQTCP